MQRAFRLAGLSSVLGVLGLVAVSCSSGEEPRENTGTVEQAITDGCNLEQVGAPCRLTTGGSECAGVCAIMAGGFGGATVGCRAASSVTENNGKVCGKGANEPSDCSKTCVAGVCTSLDAVLHTACRPSFSVSGRPASICDGECNGSGNCVAFTTRPCPLNKPGDCKYDFCDAHNSSTCISPLLPAGTNCATGSACTTGDKCDSTGTCIGTPVLCSTTNPCLTASCDPTSGCKTSPVAGTPACAYTADRCFVGVCGSGTCNKGAAKDCADTDPCTTDGCNSSTGCTHVAKCTGDVCNIPSCDAATGTCSTTAKDCSDGDPCTTDGCALPGGCTHTIIAGCVDAGVDTGTPDTGAPDTGAVTDSGTATDSGTDTGTDTGTVIDLDSGADSGTVTDTGIKVDTGAVLDTGPAADSGMVTDTAGAKDSGAVDSATAADSGAGGDADLDAGGDDPAIDLKSGCGCRTAGEPATRGPLAALALAGLAAALVRRRRRA